MRIGLQMISVQEMMAENPVNAIQQVAKVGYKHLEFANHNADENFGVGFDISAKDLKKVMEDVGADCIGTHVVPLNEENVKRIVEYHLEAGCPRITVCGSFYKSSDDVLRMCDNLNTVGRYVKENGMAFSYHNHFQEYFQMEGKNILDIIADNTDENIVDLQVDTYWVMQGGSDPCDQLRHFGKRVAQIHQKDLPKGTELFCDAFNRLKIDRFDEQGLRNFSKGFVVTEIGSGVIDIQKIIDVANDVTAAEYIILEHDGHKEHSEIDSISMSYENLANFKGIITE